MADLTTLDPLSPPDTEIVGQGAQRIRETRDAIKTSFDVEHALAGAHQFIFGAPGVRPAAGNAGRMFWDTTNERIERDTGSAWSMLHALQGYFTANAAGTPVGTGFTSVLNQSIDVATGGKAIFIARARALNYGSTVTARITVDGVVASPGENAFQSASALEAYPMWIAAAHYGLAAGSRSVSLEVKVNAGSLNIQDRAIITLVF